jgi:outer membrane protein assembly factor BamE
MPLRQTRLVLAAAAAVVLATGCGSMDGAGHRLANAVTPYKVEVVQGNFVSREQVEALHKGMAREQVRQILGTPLITDLFHAGRWDYVFTLKRQGVAPQQRRLTVFFANDVLDRVEGDPMPSESEFVTTLEKRKTGKVPRLEATEEELRAFQGRNQAAAEPQPEPPAAPAVPKNYPPLEPASR